MKEGAWPKPDNSWLPGKKKERARLTAHFCCNADGTERLVHWNSENTAVLQYNRCGEHEREMAS